jgi:hypothetical protein
MASVDPGAIEGEIDRLRSLDLEGLRREWRRLWHSEPPRISRDLLALGLGYRLQEIAQGVLSKATRRKLQTMAKALRTTGRVGPAPSLSLKSGARLVREWGGRTHRVTVTEDGFEYAGKNYPSLTQIAKKITGALVGTALLWAALGSAPVTIGVSWGRGHSLFGPAVVAIAPDPVAPAAAGARLGSAALAASLVGRMSGFRLVQMH